MRGVLRVALFFLFTFSLHAADFVVTNTNADGEGSLAAAVGAANFKPGSRVLFGIEGAPPFTIELSAPLKIASRMSIGGDTQPGYAGTPLITIVNRLTTSAIEITAAGSSVAALAFQLAEGGAVDAKADSVTVASCTFTRIGAPHAHEQPAVRVAGSRAQIWRNRAAFGTCISLENGEDGSVYGNTLEGCYATSVALRSARDTFLADNIIGPAVIANSAAIAVDGTSPTSYIARNRITDVYGGIDIRANDSYVNENVIRNASAYGIRVDAGKNNRLTENLVTGANGIVLVNKGNHGLVAPRIHNVVVSGDTTTITGNLNGSSYYELEFYVSDECGGAPRFAGSVATGDLNYTVTIPAITPGSRVSAIAVDIRFGETFADTSAFSNCVTASGSPSVPPPVLPSFKAEGGEGDYVTLAGTNIHKNARVFFGANEGTFDRYSITPRAQVPAGSGTVDVTVRNPDLREVVVRNAFTYAPPCAVYVNRHADDVAIERGQSATLSVLATPAGGGVTYQWYRGRYPSRTAPIAGATSSSLTVTPDVTTEYWVEIKNACGKFNISGATVSLPRRRASAH